MDAQYFSYNKQLHKYFNETKEVWAYGDVVDEVKTKEWQATAKENQQRYADQYKNTHWFKRLFKQTPENHYYNSPYDTWRWYKKDYDIDHIVYKKVWYRKPKFDWDGTTDDK